MGVFSKCVLDIRREYGWSHKKMVEFLIKSNIIFSKIDCVTLSRWESSKTTPPLRKRIVFLDLFGCVNKYFFLESGLPCNKNGAKIINDRFDYTNKHQFMFLASENKINIRTFNSYNKLPNEIKKFHQNCNYNNLVEINNMYLEFLVFDETIITGFFCHVPINDSFFLHLKKNTKDLYSLITKKNLQNNSDLNALLLLEQNCFSKTAFEMCNLYRYIELGYSNYSKLYVCLHNAFFLKIMLKIGFSIAFTFVSRKKEAMKEDNVIGWMLVIDRIDYLSNRTIFETCCNIYNRLGKNNPDLLKQLRESNETRSNRFKAYC